MDLGQQVPICSRIDFVGTVCTTRVVTKDIINEY